MLLVPKYKLNFFIGQLVNELVKYGKKVYNNQTNSFEINVNGKILDDSVSVIIDRNIYNNSDNVIYDTRLPSEDLLSRFENKEY